MLQVDRVTNPLVLEMKALEYEVERIGDDIKTEVQCVCRKPWRLRVCLQGAGSASIEELELQRQLFHAEVEYIKQKLQVRAEPRVWQLRASFAVLSHNKWASGPAGSVSLVAICLVCELTQCSTVEQTRSG